MNSFWKNEWNMFCSEIDTTINFLMQPVKLFGSKEDDLRLRPSANEISEKRESSTFWKNEWNMFCDEVDTTLDYLTKPMEIK
ncbi:MAG: hypothetical protein RR144_02915 [Clostridia bacterium]